MPTVRVVLQFELIQLKTELTEAEVANRAFGQVMQNGIVAFFLGRFLFNGHSFVQHKQAVCSYAKITQGMLYPVAFLCGYQFFGNILYLVGMAPGMNNYKCYDLKPGGVTQYGQVTGRGKIKCWNGFGYLLAAGLEPADDV